MEEEKSREFCFHHLIRGGFRGGLRGSLRGGLKGELKGGFKWLQERSLKGVEGVETPFWFNFIL